MRLKTKLFLINGALFFLAFVLSYFFELWMTRTNLQKAQVELESQINAVNEKKRKDIEVYLSGVLAQEEAKINSLLLRIKNFDPMRRSFEMEKSEYDQNIWLESATLLSSNKWVDLIQTMYNEELTSLIAVDPKLLEEVDLYKTPEGVMVALSPKDDREHEPYIAIPVALSDFLSNVPPIKNPEFSHSQFYALFTKESLMKLKIKDIKFQVLNLSINPLEPYVHWIEADYPKTPIAEFVKHIQNAQEVFAKKPGLLKKISEKRPEHQKLVLKNLEDQQLKSLISRYDQIGMIWGLITLISSGPFSFDPFNSLSPVGFVRRDSNLIKNVALYKDEVFFQKPFVSLSKETYSKQKFENKLSVIIPKSKKSFYFGNTLPIHSKYGRSEVTIGINGSNILKNLSLATHTMSAFISEGLLMSAYNEKAEPENAESFSKVDVKTMLQDQTGIIRLNGAQMYFIHMKPFEKMDFHFYILKPVAEEFGLVYSMKKDAERLISRISLQMRIGAFVGLIIVLIFLSQIAKRITQPISVLAKASADVKEGKLQEVHIPELKKSSEKNEVDILYKSFTEMVDGLKEKERVRGVLNKVVSQEIADEILKSETHLGGEEKLVTVFFADVRNFTAITEKMSPQEVIQFLNECMTKVSNIIDSFGGVIDKYVGDEVMALFGAPLLKPESTQKAVLCAIEIQKSLMSWNENRVKENLPKVEMGIGIHRGNMLAGNMGAENRLNYTVLGSNVNQGARLCSLAKAGEILISKEVFEDEQVRAEIKVEKKENISLEGFSEQFEVYKVNF